MVLKKNLNTLKCCLLRSGEPIDAVILFLVLLFLYGLLIDIKIIGIDFCIPGRICRIGLFFLSFELSFVICCCHDLIF